MKKFFLSAGLVITFAFYALWQNISGISSGSSMASNPVQPNMQINSNVVYKDGQYTGLSADAYYGNIQVKAVVQNGKLTDVQFLDYPQDRGNSIRINTQAMPMLKSEAIQAQSANVNIVTGATDSSLAFKQSLADALRQAS